MELLVRKPGSGRPTHDEGDVFEIFPDGELPDVPAIGSPWWIIRIPGVDPALWQHLLESSYNTTDPSKPVLIHRRIRKINWSSVPAPILSQLQTNRKITINATQLSALPLVVK